MTDSWILRIAAAAGQEFGATEHVQTTCLTAIRESPMIAAYMRETGTHLDTVSVPEFEAVLAAQIAVIYANPPVDRGAVERILYEVYALETSEILGMREWVRTRTKTGSSI